MSRAVKQPAARPYSETSRVVRISEANYAEFKRIKDQVAKRLKLSKLTHDAIFSETLKLMNALVAGDELYIVDKLAFSDLAEARGEAIRQAVRAKQPPSWPVVCLKLGSDDGLMTKQKLEPSS